MKGILEREHDDALRPFSGPVEAVGDLRWREQLGAEPRPRGRVAQAPKERIIAPRVSPRRDRRVERRGPGEIGVLVGGDVEPGRTRRVDSRQDVGHPSPVAASRDLEVPDLGRNAGLPGDAERLVQGGVDLPALVAHVRRVHAAVTPRGFRQRDDLLGRSVEGGGILDRRGEAQGALPHGGLHERDHAGQLLGSRAAVLLAHDGYADLRRPDERRDVDGAARAREMREVAVEIAPILLDAVLLHPDGVVGDQRVGERGDRPAFPRHFGGDSLSHLAEHPVVHQDARFRLAEHVDEPRRDDEAGHVERLARPEAAFAQKADGGDAVAADRDVAGVARIAAAVDDPAAPQEDVVGTAGPVAAAEQQQNQERGGVRASAHFFQTPLRESGRKMRPRLITQAMLRVAAMLRAGFAFNTTRSATFPGATRPSESARSSWPPRRVAAVIASSGVSPAATSRAISSCNETPGTRSWLAASVPAAIAPPARWNSRTNWSWRGRERRKASKSRGRHPERRSRPATSRTLRASSGTSSIPGRVSRTGLSSRESMSCRMSVGTIATRVWASARAVRATVAESSRAQPCSSVVQPARNRSWARKYAPGLRAAACTTPAMCSSDATPARAAVSASVLPRWAATGRRRFLASSSSGRSRTGVIFV